MNNLEPSFIVSGKVISVKGSLIEANIPVVGINDSCKILDRNQREILAEVISFQDNRVLLSPYDNCSSVSVGDKVYSYCNRVSVEVPINPLGKVLDATGESLFPELVESKTVFIDSNPPNPLDRKIISEPLVTGIRSIDTMIPIGKGQRIGLFASAGLGKSTLLSSLARNIECDVCVIALIGERGREVTEFLEDLGEEGRKKSVLVISTSDELPARRMIAAYTATTIAESYRSRGKSVLLLMDSLTRFARAARDVSLSAGQLPVRQGFPADVYVKLPQLVERAGNSETGSITAVYTVLTNPDGTEDPMADEIKSLLDGHIYLDGKIAGLGIRPAIDFEKSISRLSSRLLNQEQLELQQKLKKYFVRWKNDREILLFGGTPDPELELILNKSEQMIKFLNQTPNESFKLEDSWSLIKHI